MMHENDSVYNDSEYEHVLRLFTRETLFRCI